MNFNELYLALKQNVVNGQENPLPTINSGKFYEVQKYLILTGHIITARIVTINETVWQKISEEDRKIMLDVVNKNIEIHNNEIKSLENSLINEFEKAGVTVITPNVEEFRDVVLKSVPAKLESRWGKGLFLRRRNGNNRKARPFYSDIAIFYPADVGGNSGNVCRDLRRGEKQD